jgi:hypothetical protein
MRYRGGQGFFPRVRESSGWCGARAFSLTDYPAHLCTVLSLVSVVLLCFVSVFVSAVGFCFGLLGRGFSRSGASSLGSVLHRGWGLICLTLQRFKVLIGGLSLRLLDLRPSLWILTCDCLSEVMDFSFWSRGSEP